MPFETLSRLVPVTPGGTSGDSTAAPDFVAAARSVISFLHEKMGFDLWMVTRTEGNDWIVLQSEDHGYDVEPNTVFKWTDTFCAHMVAGNGPRVAPRSDDVPAYAAAPIGRQVKIGAYVGVPLTYTDGSLFGTLCAIHPTPRDEKTKADLPLIELFAAMLSSVLNSEIRASEGARQAERSREDAEIDALTDLYNRRGWNRLMEAEEERCKRYGHPACVVAIDLDGLKAINDVEGHAAGDELIRKAGHAIREAVRDVDVVARTGGDEFLVLGTECHPENASVLVQRIEEQLTLAGVSASMGYAMRTTGQGLSAAAEQADHAMYARKAARHAATAGLIS